MHQAYRWISKPTTLLCPGDFVRCIKVRINAFSKRSNTVRGKPAKDRQYKKVFEKNFPLHRKSSLVCRWTVRLWNAPRWFWRCEGGCVLFAWFAELKLVRIQQVDPLTEYRNIVVRFSRQTKIMQSSHDDIYIVRWAFFCTLWARHTRCTIGCRLWREATKTYTPSSRV